MALRERAERAVEGSETRVEETEERGEPQHEARVDHILAGGALVQAFRRRLADGGAKLFDEVGNDHAVTRETGREPALVGRERLAGLGDPRRVSGRNQAGLGLRLGQHRLEAQHGGEVGRVGEERLDRRDRRRGRRGGAAGSILPSPAGGRPRRRAAAMDEANVGRRVLPRPIRLRRATLSRRPGEGGCPPLTHRRTPSRDGPADGCRR